MASKLTFIKHNLLLEHKLLFKKPGHEDEPEQEGREENSNEELEIHDDVLFDDVLFEDDILLEEVYSKFSQMFREDSNLPGNVPGIFPQLNICGNFRNPRFNSMGIWGVERGEGGLAFAIRVKDRKKKTLLRLIKKHIMPGTTIISDEFPAYRKLEKKIGRSVGYKHYTICHKDRFVR
uniref:ISXO2-like transposase domain-containing protein n=1 Tax=Ditylenchus dipsaci TaxID=166011 RepID=A0A915E4W6_9BILA